MPAPALFPTAAWRTRAARFAAMLAMGAVLCGCSAVRLAYDNAPEIAYRWLDGYLDFRDDQTLMVRARLEELLAWHRARELPLLAALIENTARRAPADIEPADVCALDDALRERALATARQAAAPGAELAVGLDETQIRHLEEKFVRNNTAFARDWLEPDADERRRKRYDKDLERMEDFYGRLDASQRALLRDAAERSVFDPQRADAERRRRQQEALDWLRDPERRALSGSDTRATLYAYALRGLRPPPGPWHDHQDALRWENCRKVAALHNTTRPEQRERAARRLRAYAQDLRQLAASP